MKLKVEGVETLEITDPNRLCGTRKKLNQALLREIKGQAFTAAELKQMFGYGKTTALCDTQLAHLVVPVKLNRKWSYPHSASYLEERSTKWRIK
ncbi:hypothetical protein ES703_30630 [subsurface metagenome]